MMRRNKGIDLEVSNPLARLTRGGSNVMNKQQRKSSSSSSSSRLMLVVLLVVLLFAFWLGFINHKFKTILSESIATDDRQQKDEPDKVPLALDKHKLAWRLPEAFYNVLHRAKSKADFCKDLQKDDFTGFDQSETVPLGEETIAALPAFGIIDAIESWTAPPNEVKLDPNQWQCQVPPRKECMEKMFTVVFMAYNPDRLKVTFNQMRTMLTEPNWKELVQEVVLVWNGPRAIDESEIGKEMLEFTNENALRVVFPLKMGFENDLMNRYHPHVVDVKTKAILYYDDDGPFYSFEAIQAGFELWKRHASAQIGAMARQINYGERQVKERLALGSEPNDRLFIAHCDNVDDQVDYNFRYFANYDANMVLPSGSFLHSFYLCFLWHPVLEPIRKFVRAHPVHPDDMTVSLVVSQLAGRAPRVYSRRLKPDPEAEVKAETQEEEKDEEPKEAEEKKRRLTTELEEEEDYFLEGELIPESEYEHRRLMFSINWDAGAAMNDKKRYWAALRTEAINSLVRYFGSINSGSIGWCEGSKLYYNPKKDGRCDPIMARQGWLPWMKRDGSVKSECP